MSYVITAQADNEETQKFYRTGEWAGEWVRSYKQATEFDSYNAAMQAFERDEFNKPTEMSSGVIYPPHMIRSGANLNIDRPTGSVTIRIQKLTINLTPLHSEEIRDLPFQLIRVLDDDQRLNQISSLIEKAGLTEEDIKLFQENRK